MGKKCGFFDTMRSNTFYTHYMKKSKTATAATAIPDDATAAVLND
jgi:hypothetical protein